MGNTPAFFERVKSLVKAKNTTIEAFLDSTFGKNNVTRNVYNGWRSRGILPRADYAVKMAEYLGVSVEYLVNGKDSDLLIDAPESLRELFRTILELSSEQQFELKGAVLSYVQTNFKKNEDSITEEKIG